MDMAAKLVTGRLGGSGWGDGVESPSVRPVGRYGVGRFGLVSVRPSPSAEPPADDDAGAAAACPSAVREAPSVRLGWPAHNPRLCLPAPQVAKLPDAAAVSEGPRRKGTYRLPAALVCRLRALARATHRYQYVVVAEALQAYLARAVDSLGFRERAALAHLEAVGMPTQGAGGEATIPAAWEDVRLPPP